MGLKQNISYNFLLTASQYVISLIIFPYISRTLGVESVGIIGFVDNIINYFIIFSTLGISLIGTREVAYYKYDPEKLNKVYSSLITILIWLSLAFVILYVTSVFTIEKLKDYKLLFMIGISKLIFSVFLVDWFFKGIENFKFITLRNLIIRLLYVILIFIFIKDKGDTIIYFILTSLAVVGNSLTNMIYTRKFVKLRFSNLSIKQYIPSILQIGSYTVLTSMYTTFNIVYLGFVTDAIQVGYYWAALQIYIVIIGLFTAFTSVMMPRMSSLFTSGKKYEFNELALKSFAFLFKVSLPIVIISTTLSKQIIYFLSGEEFIGAIVPMQIIMPVVLIVGIAQILAIQILMPMGKDKLVLYASIIGASTGIILNILIVQRYGSVGTAIVVLVTEFLVTAFYIIICVRLRIIKFPILLFIKNLFFSIPYLGIAILAQLFFNNSFHVISFALSLSLLYFALTELLLFKTINMNMIHDLIKSNK